ncbi:hypothetical protein VKT23_006492 [Stygiomarasmius scandens]|uniref:Glucose-methanol-choline oxidoreductase N-terminal domain-containing protein n=1 Tax=Marasmiellus scandens TaxID=2682957 RepID=A0ABR1JR89_9AGAR
MTVYDVIVVGGGASGCVVAGRLAAANPSLRILIIESGPNTENNPKHVQPLAYLTHFPPDSKTMKYYHGKMNGDRAAVVPAGNCLGGGASVNLMVYTRGSASDYDDWRHIYGNEGWGIDELKPLFRKTETYLVKEGQDTHGYSGPLKVSIYDPSRNVLANQFLDLVKKYDKNTPVFDDVNELSVGNGWSRWARWIDPQTGKRQDTAHTFVYGNLKSTELQVLTECQVTRVLIDSSNRATGVEYVCVSDAEKVLHTAEAKLIVLSAGTLSTPSILERSGIGRRDILESADIIPIVELPGVGENYHDHDSVMVPYYADEAVETIDAYVEGDQEEIASKLISHFHYILLKVLSGITKEWLETGQGKMQTNGMDVAGKIRPTEDELREMGPEFQQRWKDYFENAPDKPVLWMGVLNGYAGDRTGLVPGKKYFSMGYYLTYPASVGHVHIKSKDVNTPPDFDTGFLSNPADLVPLVWGYKRTRELARRLAAYRGVVSKDQPQFTKPELQGFNETYPVPTDCANLSYESEDNEVIKAFVQNRLATTWHSLGTCAMKPREQGGVVDNKLNVYGIEALKVADMSICPSNIGGNTYSTALLIGEKAAEIIGSELDIKV